MTNYIYKSYVRGPRWAGIKEFLFELASIAQVYIRFLEEDQGWLHVTVWYEIEGQKENLDWFKSNLAILISK